MRKGFAELQGSAMLQPQQVTAFPAEHMFVIVKFGFRPDASKHHIRVCDCLSAQFVSFSRVPEASPIDLSEALEALLNLAAQQILCARALPDARTLVVGTQSRCGRY